MKLQCGFVKVRYRGLKKNAHRLCAGKSVYEPQAFENSSAVYESGENGTSKTSRARSAKNLVRIDHFAT
jgi:hypothetical protein